MVDWCEGEKLDIIYKLPSSEIFLIFEWGKIKRGDIGSTLNIRLDIDPLLTKSELRCIFHIHS